VCPRFARGYGLSYTALGLCAAGRLMSWARILAHITASFLAIIKSGHVKTLRLPARSPNLNAFSERWVRSVKEECLSRLILFGENSLRQAMREYVAHYHAERNHQGKSNILLFPQTTETHRDKPVECRERLGGLLRYYHRAAA
jgi:putative transposase